MEVEKLKKKIQNLKNEITKLQTYKNNYHKISLNAQERTKELKCLYDIAKTIVSENDVNEVINQIIRIIPNGFQYNEITKCKIKMEQNIFQSENYVESKWNISEKIFNNKIEVGTIYVCYSKEVTEEKFGPFLHEECDLVKGISNLISLFLSQKAEKDNRRLVQQQLLHADRLATIGQLAAGVAHELNEPLGNILGYAQLAIKSVEDKDIKQLNYDLNKIEESCLYSRQIIKKLLDFARQSPSSIEILNLNEEVKKSVYFLEARCQKEGISLIKNFFEKDLFIRGDSGQIRQIITNLVINAVQAIPDSGGIINVKTDLLDKKAVIFVEDNGEGIETDDIDKIFMPFFTTKEVGAGTGLGLSVVYGIIKNHSGEIKVNSDKGKGTKFTITFPME